MFLICSSIKTIKFSTHWISNHYIYYFWEIGFIANISMSMRIFHWKFWVIMPSCPHCVHNWLFMNYLYSDGKNCNSHLCSHALTVFENRISHNLFVISNISFFISCSDLIWSRMFSGFFFAKSVSEGGIPLWNMANFRWQ